MSTDAERRSGGLPPEWDRLERAAEDLSHVVDRWVRRAREAEDEIERLRKSLEEVALAKSENETETRPDEVRRLKAENAALKSRMLQARKRVAGLMQRLAALEVEG